jgi:hypothetical protein
MITVNNMTYKEQQNCKLMFRDWFNNFLTVPVFAEYYGITESRALEVIAIGKDVHNREAEWRKANQ